MTLTEFPTIRKAFNLVRVIDTARKNTNNGDLRVYPVTSGNMHFAHAPAGTVYGQTVKERDTYTRMRLYKRILV